MTNSPPSQKPASFPSASETSPPKPRPQRRRSRKIRIFLLLIILFFATLFFGYRFFPWHDADEAEKDLIPSEVIAIGQLLPKSDVVTLGAPFGAGDASIAELRVKEGEKVKKGQLIALLDNMPHLQSRLKVATATLRVKEAALTQTRTTIQAAYGEARAARRRAKNLYELAKTEFERIKTLNARGVASNSAYDKATGAIEETQRAYEISLARFSRYAQFPEGRQADILLQESLLAEARANLAQARKDLAKGRVVSPMDGTLITLHLQIGEHPSTKGIANIGDLETMKAEVVVYQTDVAYVLPGQPVVMRAEALPGETLSGTVARIGFEVEKQDFISNDPSAHTNARIIRVTVMLDPKSSRRVARLTGLEIIARIKTGKGT